MNVITSRVEYRSSILTDHDLFGSDVEQDCSYTVFAVVFFFTLTKHSFSFIT